MAGDCATGGGDCCGEFERRRTFVVQTDCRTSVVFDGRSGFVAHLLSDDIQRRLGAGFVQIDWG